MRLIEKQSELNFEPGTKYLYSNTNYLLLGQIVEHVSGLSLKEFLSRYIFGPLRMTHATLSDNHRAVIPHRAFGYLADSRLETGEENDEVTGMEAYSRPLMIWQDGTPIFIIPSWALRR